MKYAMQSKVRYSEIDSCGKIKLSAIMNYFQDCSTFHSEEVGVGLAYLREKQKAWILLGWQIAAERRAEFGENITVETWASEFQGIYGQRNFQMLSERGVSLVKANSIWVYMDIERGRPCRPEAEELERYGVVQALEMKHVPRKIKLPVHWEDFETFPVRNYHIDTNGHVNNSQYVQMAQEFLDTESTQVRVEYKRAATFGDKILPRIAKEKERTVIELCSLDKEIFAIVEFENG